VPQFEKLPEEEALNKGIEYLIETFFIYGVVGFVTLYEI